MTARRRPDRNNDWWVDFWFHHADGNRQRVRQRAPVQTKRGAEEYERQLRAEFLNPTPKVNQGAFADLAEVFEARHIPTLKHSTQIRYRFALRKRLLPFFGDHQVASIDGTAVADFRTHLAAIPLAPKTIKNHLMELARILSKGVEWGLLDARPKIEYPKVPKGAFRYLEEPEIVALLANGGPYWGPPIRFALMTGARMGEVFALEREQIDLDRALVHIDRAVYDGVVGLPKHDKKRYVDLAPSLVAFLRGRLPRTGLVFPSKEHGGIPRSQRADRGIRAACKRAEIAPCGWHVLRHTFASRLVSRGVSLQAVQELLGHASLTETLRYAHLAPGVKKAAVALLDLDGHPKGPK